MISSGLTFKVAKAWENHLLNHIRVVLRIKQLKNGKGHNIKKINKCFTCGKFGYSATSIVKKMVNSLGLQFKHALYDSRITLKLFYAKTKLLQKEHTRKISSVWKAERVAFFTKVTFKLAFCFVLFVCLFFFLPELMSLQIFTNWLFLPLLKMISLLEY